MSQPGCRNGASNWPSGTDPAGSRTHHQQRATALAARAWSSHPLTVPPERHPSAGEPASRSALDRLAHDPAAVLVVLTLWLSVVTTLLWLGITPAVPSTPTPIPRVVSTPATTNGPSAAANLAARPHCRHPRPRPIDACSVRLVRATDPQLEPQACSNLWRVDVSPPRYRPSRTGRLMGRRWRPAGGSGRPIELSLVGGIVEQTGGYPYFLQFFRSFLCGRIGRPDVRLDDYLALQGSLLHELDLAFFENRLPKRGNGRPTRTIEPSCRTTTSTFGRSAKGRSKAQRADPTATARHRLEHGDLVSPEHDQPTSCVRGTGDSQKGP